MAENEDEKDPIRSALSDLLQSEGWRLVCEQIEQEWGPLGMGRRMAEAIERVSSGPDRAYELADAAERTYATAKAVMALKRWPQEALRTLSAGHSAPLTTVMDRMRATMRSRRRNS